MRVLLIHQYFLEKDDGGGSRFNEMTRVWEEKGHEVTVLAGMVHYNTGKKRKNIKESLLTKTNIPKKRLFCAVMFRRHIMLIF